VNCYSDLHFGKTEIFLFWGLATAGKSGITPAQAGGFDPPKIVCDRGLTLDNVLCPKSADFVVKVGCCRWVVGHFVKSGRL
jgi:hypothetical protein